MTGQTPAPNAQPATSADAIDGATLAQLSQLDPGGTGDIVRRVLETYQRSLNKAMQDFEVARAAGDMATLGRIAHTLRSSSASVGALTFSAWCKQVEIQIRDGQSQGLAAALDALQIESVRVQAALAAMLSGKGAAS